jgi:5,10-methylenetetrahydromethanopterin reductase
LWAGETVTYDGPAGRFPLLRLPQRPDNAPPPVVLAAVGPKTLELAGRCFDGVILHPFLTPEAVTRSVEIVRSAAERAGRDPSAIRCYATVVTAPDLSSNDQGLAANRWNPEDLARYRRNPVLMALGDKTADKHLSRQELVALSETLPPDWLPSSSAVGTSADCADRLRAYLRAGADEIVLHGSTAPYYTGLAEAFQEARSSEPDL